MSQTETKIYQNGKHVANVRWDFALSKWVVTNLRQHGGFGVCFTDENRLNVKDWLTSNYPGWVTELDEVAS